MKNVQLKAILIIAISLMLSFALSGCYTKLAKGGLVQEADDDGEYYTEYYVVDEDEYEDVDVDTQVVVHHYYDRDVVVHHRGSYPYWSDYLWSDPWFYSSSHYWWRYHHRWDPWYTGYVYYGDPYYWAPNSYYGGYGYFSPHYYSPTYYSSGNYYYDGGQKRRPIGRRRFATTPRDRTRLAGTIGDVRQAQTSSQGFTRSGRTRTVGTKLSKPNSTTQDKRTATIKRPTRRTSVKRDKATRTEDSRESSLSRRVPARKSPVVTRSRAAKPNRSSTKATQSRTVSKRSKSTNSSATKATQSRTVSKRSKSTNSSSTKATRSRSVSKKSKSSKSSSGYSRSKSSSSRSSGSSYSKPSSSSGRSSSVSRSSGSSSSGSRSSGSRSSGSSSSGSSKSGGRKR